jgi:hypothetical protein
MSIWDFWKTDAKDYVYGLLDASQCPPEIVVRSVPEDEAYVEVTLRRLKILYVRVGTKKFYGAVHSDAGLFHDSGQVVNFKSLISPEELKGKDVDAAHLDRVIISNQPLIGPTPYRGGSLQLNLVLLSVKSVDLAGPFLDVLSGLASAAGVSYVSVAQPFLKPLAAGIDLLTGTSGASVREIQVMTALKPLRTGVFVIVRAPSDELSLSQLRVNSDFTLTYSDGSPVQKYPYMVVSIESSPTRPDWKGIPDIKKAYDQLVAAVKKDKPKEYKETFDAFRRTALLSDDLLFDHAQELVSQVQKRMDALMGAPLTKGGTEKEVPEIEAFDPFLMAQGNGATSLGGFHPCP